jgi:ribokinase
MTQARILVVGSANIDLVATVPEVPRPGESLIGRDFKTVCGGKGANQAVAAARLGARTHFAGCVGTDGFGELQRAALTAEGIDLTWLKSAADTPTGTAIIYVADSGQNSIVVIPAANYCIRPDDIAKLAPLFDDLDAVLLQLEIPLETVEATLELARAKNVCSILDAGPAQKVSPDLLALASIVSPNETETEAITGVPVKTLEDAYHAAEALLDFGAQTAVLKLGALGALYASGCDRVYAPAFKVSPVDTVAAGDAFTAAMAVAWKTGDPAAVLRFANATGALATLKEGAQPSMPTRADVEALLK